MKFERRWPGVTGSRRVSHSVSEIGIRETRPGSSTTSTTPRNSSKKGIERLTELQDKLYAQDRWAVLLVFQAMDAAGKDGTIKHVMSGVNPQGCQVSSFKAPSAEELDHDFLWRDRERLPERGRIGIFNRSYYEEVLVVRVHPEILGSGRSSRPSSSAKRHLEGALRGHQRASSATSPATAS